MTKLLFCFLLIATQSVALAAQEGDHPLDPLSYQEIWRVLEIIRDAGHMDRETRFSQLTLHEPPKRDVLAWNTDTPMPRKAYAVVRHGKDAFEAIVDLAANQVESWSPLQGIQPNWSGDDYKAVVDKVMEHPDFLAALETPRNRRHHLPRLQHWSARLLWNRRRTRATHWQCPVRRTPRSAECLDSSSRGLVGGGRS